ncbi:MAG TPA: hypothetical protein VEY06_09260 [Flavisolibacter sp.]|nr:hypothetical protein [Flavisolibacter sp.]
MHTTDYSQKIKPGGRKAGANPEYLIVLHTCKRRNYWIGCKPDAIEAEEECIAHLAELNGQERVTATCTGGCVFKRWHY